ncbi:hypothetical protein QTP70_013523 [Hemibagrus guttatus]|uniref:Voltage-dependent calcium channel gamma-3 subunit n=1 Tax=Hemibagrus guttatus TaxID=175788 RepID=A0AAE0PYS8_9TELE|nr:hypothetical protein QTP70_013523 [Hemibagrus guttatus]
MLITTAGAFAAFSLMTIAVGTDYWLYSPGVCRTESTGDNETSQKNEEVLTHSGLWRQCCMEGAVRASSLFPILSVGLLFIGGVCVAASEFYKNRHNVILSAGIFFVSAGLSNIIGIIVYISANAGDPNQSESKRSHWYGWSFYCGALSFIMAETVGALTVHLFIDSPRARAPSAARLRARVHASLQSRRSSSYRSRYRGHHAHVPPRSPGGGRPSNDELALSSLRHAPFPPPLAHAHYIKAENGLACHAHSHGARHEKENSCALPPQKKRALPPLTSNSAATRRPHTELTTETADRFYTFK